VCDHREIVLSCLTDDDITIRTRALELLAGIVSRKSLVDLVHHLLQVLKRFYFFVLMLMLCTSALWTYEVAKQRSVMMCSTLLVRAVYSDKQHKIDYRTVPILALTNLSPVLST
jgi:hypothetical protein